MEINITALMDRKHEMHYYAASRAELGEDAVALAFANALDFAEECPLLTTNEQVSEARDYFREFGAWEDEQIDAWNDNEVNAMLLQFVAGDIRERMDYEDEKRMDEYEQTVGGRIYVSNGGEWFYYVGT